MGLVRLWWDREGGGVGVRGAGGGLGGWGGCAVALRADSRPPHPDRGNAWRGNWFGLVERIELRGFAFALDCFRFPDLPKLPYRVIRAR